MTKIISKKQIPWGQVIVIRELIANPRVVKEMERNVMASDANLTPEQVNQHVYQLVLRDNYFNSVMDLVASCYQFQIDQTEVQTKMQNLLANDQQLNDEMAKQIVILNLKRELIFGDLAKTLRIIVSDDQVKQTLDQYYEKTGKPIREFLSNRSRFDEAKRTLTDQIISERLMNAFRADFQLEEFNKKMQVQQNQAAAAKDNGQKTIDNQGVSSKISHNNS